MSIRRKPFFRLSIRDSCEPAGDDLEVHMESPISRAERFRRLIIEKIYYLTCRGPGPKLVVNKVRIGIWEEASERIGHDAK